MKRTTNPPTRRPAGFSFPEALVVVLIAAGLILMLHSLFSSGVRQTIKGTSLLTTIKEAGDLFSAIRRDLLNSHQVMTLDDADLPQSLVVSSLGETLPAVDKFPYPSALTFSQPDNATVTYLLYPFKGNRKGVVRILKSRVKTERRLFAVPRVRVFRTLVVLQEHSIQDCPMFSRHLFVELELQDKDVRNAHRPIRLAFFLSPSNLNLSSWNYFSKIPKTP